jgi:hypothetical protein
MNALALVKQENFGNVLCNFYKNQGNDILMTREQIGLALEYKDPMVAIAKIHLRNPDRFNKFSFTKLVNGRDTYFYTSKGIYEICRWSRQAKADEFIDWAWSVIDNLRQLLQQKQTQEWQESRLSSKSYQKELADTIQKFVEYATVQGSSKPSMYYKHFATLSNSMTGIENRNMTEARKLQVLTFVMDLIKNTLEQQMSGQVHYKEAYKNCKNKVEDFMSYIQPLKLIS